MNEFSAKLQELFSERLIDLDIRKYRVDDEFVELLFVLQQKIYDLDLLLESRWVVPENVRGQCWDGIYQCLVNLGVELNDLQEYCKEINIYEAREMDLRSGHLPVHVPFTEFYFDKSCDVRLLRKLIWEKYDPWGDWDPEIFAALDQVTELIDDLDDLEEDAYSYSLNFIMVLALVFGPDVCRVRVIEFIKYTEQRLQKLQEKTASTNNREICDIAVEKMMQIRATLDSRLDLLKTLLDKDKILIQNKLDFSVLAPILSKPLVYK